MLLQVVQHPEHAVAFDAFDLGEGSKASVSCEKHGLRFSRVRGRTRPATRASAPEHDNSEQGEACAIE